MTLEQKVFAGRVPDPARLVGYGFVFAGGAWEIALPFMDGDFTARIRVAPDGSVSGRVIDSADGLEYLPLRSESRTGPYVSRVREEYQALLSGIAEKCFTRRPFVSDQANRIAELVLREFGEKPDFPFSSESVKSAGVFRNAENKKWYGIVMNVPRNRLEGESSAEPADVMNVKHAEDDIPLIVASPGVYPAWHMQKKYWISLILDDTLSDARIMELVRESRGYTLSKAPAAAEKAPSWVIPANPAMYDVEAALKADGTIWWHQQTAVREGDSVYVYATAPVKAILWRLTVTKADEPIPESEREEYGVTWKKRMYLRLDKTYDRRLTGMDVMKRFGVSYVRGARRITKELEEYLESLG